ncbi:MAG: SdpI family protein [Thermoplasmata archaeon]|nr:SdpI family protein [Thermoplasmata archaeon]
MIIALMVLIYLPLALLQYFVAPKVGPNPFFGFRVGYTFSSREVWEKTNRFVGRIMLIHALLLIPFIYLGDAYIIPFLILFILPIVATLPIGIRYASYTLEMAGARSTSASTRKMEPIDVGGVWVAAPAVLYILLIIIVLLSIPHLPERVAVHFDERGNPNGWMGRERLLITYPLLSLIFPVIAYVYIYISRKYPLFIHPGRMRFRRDAILKLSVMAVSSGLVVLILVYISIVLNAIREGFMKVYVQYLVVASFMVLIPPFVWLFTKGRIKRGERR